MHRRGSPLLRGENVTAESSRNQGSDRRTGGNWRRGHGRGHYPTFGGRLENVRRDGGNYHHAQNMNLRRPRQIGFVALENLLASNPENIILELLNSKTGIGELIKRDLTDDNVILIIKLLRKVCETQFCENKCKVLQTYLNGVFLEKLRKYIAFLPTQSTADRRKNVYFWKDSDNFWENLVVICKEIEDTLPTFAMGVLPDLLNSLILCFPSFETQHKQHISDEIKEKVNNINQAIQSRVVEYAEQSNVAAEKKINNNYEEEPPDDFRQISVYPSSIELLSNDSLFLRENVIKGPYKDADHYLDVQFRLLREDFVGPLRSGIISYLSKDTKKQKKIENVTIHQNVWFLTVEILNEHYCFRIRFDDIGKKKGKKLNFEHSRRFMFGSLLCFTNDNFKSFIFGKIVERKLEDLQKGELIVGFDRNFIVDNKRPYTMIECGVYFEPYYHVLHSLQRMNIESFPMEKYIIGVNSMVSPPQYLEQHQMNDVDTFSGRLNLSQDRAFKAALAQEFCIIQGPPGTGKTFLGLQIAKTLIHNKQLWYRDTPMLIISFTNHALDQFLEGITRFTQDIIRIGGQSKNENLQKFNLRHVRKGRGDAVSSARFDVQNKLESVKEAYNELKLIDSYTDIRCFRVFENVVPEFRRTWFFQAGQDEILDWLLERRHVEGEAPIPDSSRNIHINNDNNSNEDESETSDKDRDEDFVNVEDDLFTDFEEEMRHSTSLVCLTNLSTQIQTLEVTLNKLRLDDNPSLQAKLKERILHFDLFDLNRRYVYLRRKLDDGQRTKDVLRQAPTLEELNNPWSIYPNRRWDVYFYWLNLYRHRLQRQYEILNGEFQELYRAYEEIRDVENVTLIKDALVVGMTTTGGARLWSSLQAIKSPIVIVEEAAEVLEAHIVASLTKHCQHLILIGDHKQLKPSTANYQIERFYKLGISLFERMVINNIQLFTLNVQHRMRPEISSLITPTIYPDLQNHDSVLHRPPIKGIDKCLFFIDHTHQEVSCDGTSKMNYHEVLFLIYLARHLILNGYKPEEVTILAAYMGQMFELQKERNKHAGLLAKVKIAVLDNYQGEECDIILLSLVRSNSENKIGFLGIENRVCVAMSRARNGFYICGNMAQLCQASELWQKIQATLQEQGAIGAELALRCQIHSDKVTHVQSGEDFLAISEGGCNQKCAAALKCGHICARLCHIIDRNHDKYQCRKVCGKTLCDDELHTCLKMCHVPCGPCNYPVKRILSCGHELNLECHVDPTKHDCNVLISTELPCGHVCDKPCHKDANTYSCPYRCPFIVESCGHACTWNCHVRNDPDHLQYKCPKPCARYNRDCVNQTQEHMCKKLCFEKCERCLIPVKKKRTNCDHMYEVPCSSNVDMKIKCLKPCKKILPCGHKCKNKCEEPCGPPCHELVDKLIATCGHSVKVKCSVNATRDLCKKKCPLELDCGHPCTKNCNEICTQECTELVACNLTAPCGHIVTQVGCRLFSSKRFNDDANLLLKYCKIPCRSWLACNHLCSGSCGDCSQGRVHKRCAEKCGFPLVCDHPCAVPCREACKPCTRRCPYKCKHSSCSKKCGDVCTMCTESCTRICKHQRCSKFCGEICNVPPCEEPCPKRLKCGHSCVGFCGDRCPSKCLICHKNELTEVFFGTEEDEDARFVVLEDCEHILESKGLESWLQQDDETVGFKVCPRCKTSIKTTQRYSDHIKRAMLVVSEVKLKTYGTRADNEERRMKLRERSNKLLSLARWFVDINNVILNIEDRLKAVKYNKRQVINKQDLLGIDSKLHVIEHILNICTRKSSLTIGNWGDTCRQQVAFISNILLRDDDCLTQQEVEDINFELNRFARIVDFECIKDATSFYMAKSKPEVENLLDLIVKRLFGTGKFYDADEKSVQELLIELSKAVASTVSISEKEKREIVNAMGFKGGHWFKCPNGHPYVISDCGGAMVISKCNECGARIGGTSHRLVADNLLASEMDGATHPAWSEATNMANYRF